MDSKQNSNTKKLIVVGGGIGGLFASWKLLQQGYKVTIIERQNFLGGLSTSIKKIIAILILDHIIFQLIKHLIYTRIFVVW